MNIQGVTNSNIGICVTKEKSGGVGNSSEAGGGTGENIPPGFYKQHRRGRHPSSADRRSARRAGAGASTSAQVSTSQRAPVEETETDLELCALGIATPMPVAQSETEVSHRLNCCNLPSGPEEGVVGWTHPCGQIVTSRIKF